MQNKLKPWSYTRSSVVVHTLCCSLHESTVPCWWGQSQPPNCRRTETHCILLFHADVGHELRHLQVHKGMSIPDFLSAALPLVAPMNAYFDKVFVMTDDSRVKDNRLALLQKTAVLAEGILDFAELPGF